MRLPAVLLAAAVLAGVPAGAAAQTATVTEERQLTLPAGKIFAQAFAEVSLSKDAAFEPFSIAPDIWYGVMDELSVGLVHSGRASTGLYGIPGNGLCLSGESGNCARVYDNIGLDARYHLYREGGITLSADGGLFAQSFDPFTMSLKVGAIGRWESGAMSVELGPNLFVGLTQRSPEEGMVEITAGNKEIFYFPATFMYALSPRLGLAGQLGAIVPFESAGDVYMIGASVGAQYMATENILVDAAFSLPALVSGDAIPFDAADLRTITLGVGYAM